ncbi:MAG: histidinol-phosphatase HisJ family protein [Candidatus Moranbacteria bacterium]|nr:histidinol-phosphatase HisJ family protein [Candidatus Moranbacteria bacterium]
MKTLVDHHIHILEKSVLNSESLDRYWQRAQKNQIGFLGFSEHAYLFQQAESINFNQWQKNKQVFDLEKYYRVLAGFRQKTPGILIGLEVDFYPERLAETRAFIEYCRCCYDFDFLSGSVHWIGDWGIDLDKESYHEKMSSEQTVREKYNQYYDLIEQMIETRLFDLVCHLDLIKIFGAVDPGNEKFWNLIKILKQNDQALEVNINGLNKPIQEPYPGFGFVKKCLEQSIPITLSSDAHEESRVGEHFDITIKELRNLGLKNLIYYEAGQRKKLFI